jgi:hypothetical protein
VTGRRSVEQGLPACAPGVRSSTIRGGGGPELQPQKSRILMLESAEPRTNSTTAMCCARQAKTESVNAENC